MTRDERVRALVEARLNGNTTTPREEARECVLCILERGITVRQIADRCGVGVNAVSNWRLGKCAPATPEKFARLAQMARSILKQQRPADALQGIPRVVYALMQALDVTASEVALRVGLRYPQAGPAWLRGAARPNRRSTVRLRTLALRAGLSDELLSICDQRVREIAAADRQRGSEITARRESKALRLQRASTHTAEEIPMAHSPSTPAPSGVGH